MMSELTTAPTLSPPAEVSGWGAVASAGFREATCCVLGLARWAARLAQGVRTSAQLPATIQINRVRKVGSLRLPGLGGALRPRTAQPLATISKSATRSRMSEDIPGEQAERLDWPLSCLKRKAQHNRSRWRQVAVACELFAVGQRDA